MAIIHDMIPAFELFQPTDLEGAVGLLDRYRDEAWVLAGGLDSMDWFKDRVKRPSVVVDLQAIPEIRGIRETENGLEIGAYTSLTEVASNDLVREQYGLLAEAAGVVATPQIRNQGTLGGNICQDTRCWYYRGGWPCYRAGGNICYADTPTAMNREHCILGANRCVAVSPSDTAPALVALDARMVVRGPGGQRIVAAEDFFMGPARDITRMTVLQPNEILATIRLPKTWAGKPWYYEKSRDRKSWDFALASVAGVFDIEDGRIRESRVAAGAVAPTPVRLGRVESTLRGQQPSEDLGKRAGEVAVAGTAPLQHNEYKVPLLRNLVLRAVRSQA